MFICTLQSYKSKFFLLVYLRVYGKILTNHTPFSSSYSENYIKLLFSLNKKKNKQEKNKHIILLLYGLFIQKKIFLHIMHRRNADTQKFVQTKKL